MTATGGEGFFFGDLTGTVTGTVLEPPRQSGNGALHFHFIDVITTADGILRTENHSVLSPIEGTEGLFHLSSRAEVIDGGGVFEGASGRLHLLGLADFGQGTLTVSYNGRIRVPAP